MSRMIPGVALASVALLVTAAVAEDSASPALLAKPGDTYVALQVEGCANKCPSFEIYVFKNGLMKFRSNNQYTSAKGTRYKNGMPDVYTQISKYLAESGAFNAMSACGEKTADTSLAVAQDSQAQRATWSSSCADQRAKGRSVVKVFVNQTGMWRLIRSDMDWWQKYWEDPQRTGREDVSQ